jgi:GTP-binding protein
MIRSTPIDMDGKIVEVGRATKLMSFDGLERVPVDMARAGDIIALAGLEKATVANTICDPSVTDPIAAQPIDPPTLAMRFSVNDSPLAGREGSKVTSRIIRDRLLREAETNVAIRVTESERQGRLRSRRARRIAAWRADRNHAPRRL